MKKIHIIPTDKPSRLSILNNGKLNFGAEFISSSNSKAQNIYITSDEEIKEGDWIFSIKTNNLFKADSIEYLESHNMIEDFDKSFYINSKYAKKIILTTDQDLDGVQAIDDEFLEWFVKNPNCESVEVKHKNVVQYGNMTMYDHNGDGSHYFCKNCEVETSRSKEQLLKFGVEYYKIIIPKEELNLNCFDCNKSLQDCTCMEDTIDMKQETLEEAEIISKQRIHKYRPMKPHPASFFIGFKAGAEWQAERMYSEEEVLKLVDRAFHMYASSHRHDAKEWLVEQFKKK